MVQNVGCLKENTYLCNRKSEMNALLAQLVEQLTLNQWVQGSNPWRCIRDVKFQHNLCEAWSLAEKLGK